MKTIKDLEADKAQTSHGQARWHGKIQALKDVLGLIDEIEVKESMFPYIDKEELKKRING